MKSLRTIVTGLAVTGLLAAGAAPAAAAPRHDSHRHNDTIEVIVLKHHEKSGKWSEEERKTLKHDRAARYAADKCGKWRSVHRYERLAKKVEKSNSKKWEYVCSYDHRKNKNVEYVVKFRDDGDRRDHGRGDGRR